MKDWMFSAQGQEEDKKVHSSSIHAALYWRFYQFKKAKERRRQTDWKEVMMVAQLSTQKIQSDPHTTPTPTHTKLELTREFKQGHKIQNQPTKNNCISVYSQWKHWKPKLKTIPFLSQLQNTYLVINLTKCIDSICWNLKNADEINQRPKEMETCVVLWIGRLNIVRYQLPKLICRFNRVPDKNHSIIVYRYKQADSKMDKEIQRN